MIGHRCHITKEISEWLTFYLNILHFTLLVSSSRAGVRAGREPGLAVSLHLGPGHAVRGGRGVRQAGDLPRGSAGESGDGRGGADLQLPHQAAVRGAAGRGQVLLHPLQHGRVSRVLHEPAAAHHEEESQGHHLRQHLVNWFLVQYKYPT